MNNIGGELIAKFVFLLSSPTRIVVVPVSFAPARLDIDLGVSSP